jgi:hypothetical protein
VFCATTDRARSIQDDCFQKHQFAARAVRVADRDRELRDEDAGRRHEPRDDRIVEGDRQWRRDGRRTHLIAAGEQP